MIDRAGVQRHPSFPDMVWVVVEQPPGAKYRLDDHREDGSFRTTTALSLFHDRGFSGAYGWIGGFGTPPEAHLDVILVTRTVVRPGDIVAAWPVGVFCRNDQDHKVVALDLALWAGNRVPDLDDLDVADRAELRALYPRVDPGEGWHGADEARRLAERWPSTGDREPGVDG